MSRNTRRINMRKLDQAYTAMERAKGYIDEVGPMYIDHSINITTELRVVSEALTVAMEFYQEYGFVALPIMSDTLDLAIDILAKTKSLS